MSDSAPCTFCSQNVSAADAVWQCPHCFVVEHLTCAQRHAARSLTGGAGLATAVLGSAPGWACPHCRAPLTKDTYPQRYRCFCGAQIEPAVDIWLPAHTCGGPCRRSRVTCLHLCREPCHAGPCADCSQTVDLACFCGRLVTGARCGTPQASCGATCGRKGTAAGRVCSHPCARECHAGPSCPPCGVLVDAPCLCGASTRRLPCMVREWRCAASCPRTLACGRCPCPGGCHSSKTGCPPCPFEGVERRCGCGREAHAGLACNAPTPRCGATCERLLPCGHTCADKCHAGPCGPCGIAIPDAPCRCGKQRRQRLCRDGVEACALRCEVPRACGRHLCRRRCCGEPADASVHAACPEVCSRTLGCGICVCGALCHAGDCEPCPRTITLVCPCGGTRRTFPCGRAPAAIVCRRDCPRKPTCRHAMRARHGCHAGPCPTCTLPCGEQRRCGHACDLPCHSDSMPALASEEKLLLPVLVAAAASGTAAAAFPELAPSAPTLLPAAKPCPRCTAPVRRLCVGGHETRETPCSAPALWRCGQSCNAKLPCGRHACLRPCHARTVADAAPCGQCTALCDRPRPPSCSHACAAPVCHGNTECPACATCAEAAAAAQLAAVHAREAAEAEAALATAAAAEAAEASKVLAAAAAAAAVLAAEKAAADAEAAAARAVAEAVEAAAREEAAVARRAAREAKKQERAMDIAARVATAKAAAEAEAAAAAAATTVAAADARANIDSEHAQTDIREARRRRRAVEDAERAAAADKKMAQAAESAAASARAASAAARRAELFRVVAATVGVILFCALLYIAFFWS